jgi:hypothetical protein
MVKSSRTRSTDVHPWSFADGFQTFQNLNLIGAVTARHENSPDTWG